MFPAVHDSALRNATDHVSQYRDHVYIMYTAGKVYIYNVQYSY